jgi:hypothetical protein
MEHPTIMLQVVQLSRPNFQTHFSASDVGDPDLDSENANV